MSTIGTTDYYAGSLVERIIAAEALVALSDANVFLPLITTSGQASADTISFPKWNLGTNTITSSDMGSHTLGSDASAVAIDSAKLTLTPAPYSFYIPNYDESGDSSIENIAPILGRLGANAVGAKIDALVAAQMADFNNNVGTSTVGITLDNLFSAIEALKVDGTQGKYRAVLHPSQYWGAYGLSKDLVTTSTARASLPTKADQLVSNGWIDNIAGIDIYISRELKTATNSHYGGVFGDGALCFGYVNPLMRAEPEREGKLLRTDYIFSMFCATSEYEDDYGCYILTKTS